MSNKIFEVDVKGLRQLQEGKPKWFIIRELLQNAMDEEITRCNIYMRYEYGKAHITVEDDSPTGFRDLADAYTLFKDTYKRSDVKKRGRFNFGEKQILCLADQALIVSTTGGLEFDVLKGERTTLRRKRERGSEVYVVVRMSREEYTECCSYCNDILVPQNIQVLVSIDGVESELMYKKPHSTFTAKLVTEVKQEDRMRNVQMETPVHVHKKSEVAYIYEMGIPICEIECEYSVDVQQKVPLSNDRDKVDGKYLKDVFALLLNNVVDEVAEENISQTWIRQALDSDKVDSETVKGVKEKRFGDKALIFNPFDEIANDEAISKGYRLIHGSEMSANEWGQMKTHAGLVSTSSMFGKTGIPVEHLEPENSQRPFMRLAERIANDFLHIEYLRIVFFMESKISAAATYGGRELSFNLSHLSKDFFLPDERGYVKQVSLDLLIHELGHEKGHHTDHSYHECITSMGAWLTLKAVEDKSYFKLK